MASLLLMLSVTGQSYATSSIHIPFILKNGMIIVEASIDNKSGYFILDTGSESVLLNTSGLKVHDVDDALTTIHGPVSGSSVTISRMAVGDIVWEDVPAFTTDMQVVEQGLGIKLSGIIGFHLFDAQFLGIDFLKGVVTLSDHSNAFLEYGTKQYMEFMIHDDLPIAKIKVKDRHLHFLLDSGASIHLIDTQIAVAMKDVFIETNTFSKLRTLSDDQRIAEIVRSSDRFHPLLDFNEFLLQDFSEIFLSGNVSIDGILSLSTMSDRIVFDVEEGKVWF